MSSRAEAAAKKAYPKEEGKVWSSAFGTFEFDKNAGARKAHQEGYEQAEKDYIELAQLWVDSGDVNIMSFKQFLKRHETQSNK